MADWGQGSIAAACEPGIVLVYGPVGERCIFHPPPVSQSHTVNLCSQKLITPPFGVQKFRWLVSGDIVFHWIPGNLKRGGDGAGRWIAESSGFHT